MNQRGSISDIMTGPKIGAGSIPRLLALSLDRFQGGRSVECPGIASQAREQVAPVLSGLPSQALLRQGGPSRTG